MAKYQPEAPARHSYLEIDGLSAETISSSDSKSTTPSIGEETGFSEAFCVGQAYRSVGTSR